MGIMGVLVYGGRQSIEFDDRLLAHLQIVIGSKLRRREGFCLSWKEDIGVGGGRATIWVDPAISLMFQYEEASALDINREWLESLTLAANSPRGLVVMEEIPHLSAKHAGAGPKPAGVR
jgi:hypothetical protein